MGGPLLKLPLVQAPSDDTELLLHKKIYAESDFQALIHAYVPEAEAQARFIRAKRRPSRK